jgi:hypothetical protein
VDIQNRCRYRRIEENKKGVIFIASKYAHFVRSIHKLVTRKFEKSSNENAELRNYLSQRQHN